MSNKKLTINQVADKFAYRNLFLTENKKTNRQNLSEKEFQLIKGFLNRIKKISQAQVSEKSYFSDVEIANALASGELKLYKTVKVDGKDVEFNYVSEQFFRQNQLLSQFEQFKGKEISFDRKEIADLLSLLIQKAFNVANANGTVKIVRPAKAKTEKANAVSA
jgi:hypothetical protein